MGGGRDISPKGLSEREREPAGARRRRVANLPVSTHASAAGSVGRSLTLLLFFSAKSCVSQSDAINA